MKSDYKKYLLSQLGIKESKTKPSLAERMVSFEVADPDELEMGTKDERDDHNMSLRKSRETATQHLEQPDQAHYYSGMEKAKNQGMLKDALRQNISPTGMRSPVIGLAVRGSSTGGFPSGLDQTGLSPSTPTGKLGGYEPIINNPVNSRLVNKTPHNISMDSPNPINDNPQTTDAVTHPFQVQQHTGEPPQDVTGASTDSNTDVPVKTAPEQNIDIDIPGGNNDMDGQEDMDQEDKMKSGVPNIEGDKVQPDQGVNETFKRHRKLMREKLGLITEATCKCGDPECTCKCKVTECGSCGCGKTNTIHQPQEGIGDGQPSPSKWRMNPTKAGMEKVGETKKSGPITKAELDQIWRETHPTTPDAEPDLPVRHNPGEEHSTLKPHKAYEPPLDNFETGAPMPDVHGNIKLDEKRGAVNPEEMNKALDRLNKHNPAAYAQLLTLPLSYIPAYAWEDPTGEWWSSDEAKMKLQQVKDACQEGPKPGAALHMPKGAKYSYQGSLPKDRGLGEGDEEEEEIGGICSGCSGSGEGPADGTRCQTCGGSGSTKGWRRKGRPERDPDDEMERRRDKQMELEEGKHKKGCKCGFCANKGNFGKKKEDEEVKEEKEKIEESYTAPFQRMRGLAGIGKTVLCSNGMWKDSVKINEINHTTDAQGNDAIAVGAPGSDARNAIEKGTGWGSNMNGECGICGRDHPTEQCPDKGGLAQYKKDSMKEETPSSPEDELQGIYPEATSLQYGCGGCSRGHPWLQ